MEGPRRARGLFLILTLVKLPALGRRGSLAARNVPRNPENSFGGRGGRGELVSTLTRSVFIKFETDKTVASRTKDP